MKIYMWLDSWWIGREDFVKYLTVSMTHPIWVKYPDSRWEGGIKEVEICRSEAIKLVGKGMLPTTLADLLVIDLTVGEKVMWEGYNR